MMTRTLSAIAYPALLLLISTHVACSGCGDEPVDPDGSSGTEDMSANNGDNNLNNNSMTSPDMSTSVDMAPVITPSYIMIEAEPVQALYRTGDTLTLTPALYDVSGEPIPEATFEVAATPATSAFLDTQGKWALSASGEVVFEACARDTAPQVCARHRVFVDDAPPTLTITSPTPGQELDGVANPVITVTGKATDAESVPLVFVNGQPASMDMDGNFTFDVMPSFGVNHIEVIATDGVNRTDARADMDVLWAPAWEPGVMEADVSGTEFEDGLLLHLGQRFFDDRRAPITTMEGKTFTEDLADILTLLARNVDFTTLIPNPIVDSDNLSVSITDFSLGKPVIQVDVTQEGIQIYISSSDLAITTQGSLTVSDQVLGLDGTITAGIGILASVSIEKDGLGQPFKVEVSQLSVAIERANSMFVDVQADAIFELAQSALRLQIENVLVGALQDSFIDTIPELLSGALNGIDSALAGTTFALEPGFVDPIDVTFNGQIEELEIEALRAVAMRVRARLVASATTKRPSLGVAMMQPYKSGDAPLLETSRIQIVLRLALINGLLHGLWDANLLDIDATGLLPDDLTSLVESATVSALLPPVARPPLKGEPFDLLLQVGELRLELKSPLTGQTVTYGVNLTAGINVGVKDDSLAVTISDEPELLIWVIETDDGKAAKLKPAQLEGLFKDQLWPSLTVALGEGLALPLPVLDIPELGTYAPRLSTFTLSFDQIGPVVVRDGFIIVDSQLRGTLPALMP